MNKFINWFKKEYKDFCVVFLSSALCIAGLFYSNLLVEHLFFVIVTFSGGITLLALCDFILSDMLSPKSRRHRYPNQKLRAGLRICQYFIGRFVLNFSIFIFCAILAWFFVHALMQLGDISLDFLGTSKEEQFLKLWLYLNIFAIVPLYILGFVSESIYWWNSSLYFYFSNATKEIRKSYLNQQMVIKFISILTIICLTLLLASYWVGNSTTSRLEELQNPRIDATEQSNSTEIGGTTDSRAVQLEAETNIIRNKWIWFFAFIGLFLTVWGRVTAHIQSKQIQEQIRLTGEQIKITRQSNSGERMQEALKNIHNEAIGIRMAGLQILMQMTDDIENVSLASVILFSFINDPYLAEEENNSDLVDTFPVKKLLRKDIQEAANCISKIYTNIYQPAVEKSREDTVRGVYNDTLKKLKPQNVELPPYFWQNEKKERVNFPHINLEGSNIGKAYLDNASFYSAQLGKAVLVEAKLQNAFLGSANLTDANLEGANLDGANLRDARLSGANLKGAFLWNADFNDKTNLTGADITGADFEHARQLTEGHVLSAQWKKGEDGTGKPPTLPDYLMSRENIIQWCEQPQDNTRS